MNFNEASASGTLEQIVMDDTRIWLERAVIGLNLCPFAKAVRVKGQIHYVVSRVSAPQELLHTLRRELEDLQSTDPVLRDTTLLILPCAWADFLEFNEVLGQADQLLAEMDLEGVLQIAAFHPKFQFAGTSEDDISNFTNRAPYPTLHLLREDSVERAVEAFPDAESIFGKNIETLERLGHAGWTALEVGAKAVCPQTHQQGIVQRGKIKP